MRSPVLRVTDLADGGVVAGGGRFGHRHKPLLGMAPGWAGWSRCRGDGQVSWLVSVTADRALASSTRFLPAAQAAMSAARARRLTARGLPRPDWWMSAVASSVKAGRIGRPAASGGGRCIRPRCRTGHPGLGALPQHQAPARLTSTTYRPQSSRPRSTLQNGPTRPWSKSNSPSLHQNTIRTRAIQCTMKPSPCPSTARCGRPSGPGCVCGRTQPGQLRAGVLGEIRALEAAFDGIWVYFNVGLCVDSPCRRFAVIAL